MFSGKNIDARIIMTLIAGILFFLLSPGVLVSLPPGMSTIIQSATHALVFMVVWFFASKHIWKQLKSMGIVIKST